MKKFILILAVLFVWGNGAWADICYDIDEQTSARAVKIIRQQKESKYCSGECRILPSIQPYADEGKVLSDMLERLIYMNNVKDGD